MSMLKKIIGYFERRRTKKLFPRKKEEYWGASCAGWSDSNKEVFPYWVKQPDGKNKYNDLKTGTIVPVYIKNGWVGFYEILGWSRQAFYDGCSWDDGRKYRLIFHHIEKDEGKYKPYRRENK